MSDKKTTRAGELSNEANNYLSKLEKINSKFKNGDFVINFSKDDTELINSTASNWYEGVLTRDEALENIKRSIITSHVGQGSERAKFIHEKLLHTTKIINDEIQIYNKKIENIEERLEQEAPDDSKNKIPMVLKDKLQIGILSFLILLLFILEIFSTGETLKSNFLFYADNSTWAYASGVIIGIGGVAVKYWSFDEDESIQNKVKSFSLFTIVIGSAMFVISVVLSQLLEGNTNNSELIFGSEMDADNETLAWSSFILVGFIFISFGALQIFFGKLSKKWSLHGLPIMKIYSENENYTHLDNELSKYIKIKGVIDKSYEVYLEIIDHERIKKSKFESSSEILLFERYRKLKALD